MATLRIINSALIGEGQRLEADIQIRDGSRHEVGS